MLRLIVTCLLCALLQVPDAAAQGLASGGPVDGPTSLPTDRPADDLLAFDVWLSRVADPQDLFEALDQHLPEGWIPGPWGTMTPTAGLTSVGFPLLDASAPGLPEVGALTLGMQGSRVLLLEVREASVTPTHVETRHRFAALGSAHALLAEATWDLAGGLVSLSTEAQGYGGGALGDFVGTWCMKDCVETLFGTTAGTCFYLTFYCGGSFISACQLKSIKCNLTPQQTSAVFNCVQANCF